MARRSFLAPEVVQTSAMDCGPAALRSLLEGFGIRASYGRLREACQTDVDGTSINTIEDVANLLGLDARQSMLPLDHLFLPDARTLPALMVTRQPNGQTHFLVVWRRNGPLLQLMDPATGRRWIATTSFLRDLYIHGHRLPAAAWRAWAGSPAAVALMRARLRDLGVDAADQATLIDAAIADPAWHSLAALDAAIRMVRTLVDADAVRKGPEAGALIATLIAEPSHVPEHVWAVSRAPLDDEVTGGDEMLVLRGAVFVHIAGTKARSHDGLSRELTAALEEPAPRPGLALLALLREDGRVAPLVLGGAMAAAAAGRMIEAVLLRGLFDVGRELPLVTQRFGAYAAVIVFALALLLIEIPLAAGLLRLGRRLEIRLRRSFLEKVPRLADRYFRSRPRSDMAERCHALHRIRHVPELGGRLVRISCELTFTTLGLIWLDPALAPIAILALVAALAPPLVVQPRLAEQELRFRSHGGALTGFYLDALLGLIAIRVHGADSAVRRAHRQLTGEWATAGLRVRETIAIVEGVQLLSGALFAAWLLFDHAARAGDSGSTLLLVYWALTMPALAQDLAAIAWQYPHARTTTLRLLEPLGALEEAAPSPTLPTAGVQQHGQGVAIAINDATLRLSGHLVLDGLTVDIEAGSHVAVVGRSGAGKSSLVGLLLGWHRAASGTISMNGQPVSSGLPESLRARIAWIDPEVQLWNRTLLDNVTYGASTEARHAGVSDAIHGAELIEVLEDLPDGLQTPLGEGGARLSGGEGQRVRFARALVNAGAGLVILDEPFRGLEHDRRAALLARARTLWAGATMICVTHDVRHTTAFDRVLVIEGGQIVEDGTPAVLAAQPTSHYRAMLDHADSPVWSGSQWRRLRVHDGHLSETPLVPEATS